MYCLEINIYHLGDIGVRFSVRPSFRPSVIPFTFKFTLALNINFSKTTAPMVLKFHKEHDQTARPQNGKNQPCRESKMAAIATNFCSH